MPFPGKAPYPNALDGSDADIDFDGDGLTLKMEYQAWNYSGRPQPLNYSDGNPEDGRQHPRDGEKDVDNDGLTNCDETTGPMRMAWWASGTTARTAPKETPYSRLTGASSSPASSIPTPTATASSTATTTRTTTAT